MARGKSPRSGAFAILSQMKILKKGIYLTLGIALIVWSFYAFLQQPAPEKYQGTPIIKIGEHSILIEVADTDIERSQGLSGRESLLSNSGLLFVFEKPGVYGFWMKEMRFSIDIVWINEEWEVVGVHKEVKPETYPNLFYPNAAVKYVLELNSGTASRVGIDTGRKLYLTRVN